MPAPGVIGGFDDFAEGLPIVRVLCVVYMAEQHRLRGVVIRE